MSNSWDAVAWARRVSKGHPLAAKWLLVAGLAPRVNSDDESYTVFPSIRQLADDTDMSRSSIKRWLKYLADEKLIEVFEATRGNGGRSSNRYRLKINTVHFRPDGQAVEVGSNLDRGGGSNLDRGGVQIGPGGGSTGGPCNINTEFEHKEKEHTGPPDGGEGGELPLGLPPLPTEEDTIREFAAFVEENWAGLVATIPTVKPLRGGLGEARARKAMELARGKADPGESERDVWEAVFERILSSHWMCGRPSKIDQRIFNLQMTWLLEKRNFEKTVEGKFDDGRDPTIPGAAQSRRSPASEALALVLARRGARRERRAGEGSGRRFGTG